MAKTACQSDAGFRRYKLLKGVMVGSGLVGSGRSCVRKIPYPVRTHKRYAFARNKCITYRYVLSKVLAQHRKYGCRHCRTIPRLWQRHAAVGSSGELWNTLLNQLLFPSAVGITSNVLSTDMCFRYNREGVFTTLYLNRVLSL